MSKKLFDDSDGSDEDLKLKTNDEYAQSYNSFRKKELLKKYKDRGIDISESDSDSESSEDEEELDPKFDEAFFKALASLKSKDPKIYDRNVRFFDALQGDRDHEGGTESDAANSDGDGDRKKEKKRKPVTLKDYEREVMLKHGGIFEEDGDGRTKAGKTKRAESPSLAEAEREVKNALKTALEEDSDAEQEEFGGIFKRRTKTLEETEKEDRDYSKWLAGKKAAIESDMKSALEPLKSYWSSDKLPQSEKFLRDYILSKGFNETDSNNIPTYNEIVGDDSEPEAFSEDEKELEKQAEFEEKFNFRFEEPDAEFVKRYPRTIENSVRRSDDKRKKKREQLKERKQQEKQQKLKELELIKELKRKEIEEKVKKLKAVTGEEDLAIDDEELEKDFDPEEHDRRMREIFNDEYYKVDEGEEKPECPSDIEELKVEDWDNYDPVHGAGELDDDPHCEDEDFNMDCDYDASVAKQQLQQELIENTKKRKRRGRRNRFMEMIQKDKPPFRPEDEKTYGEYIDEYYAMDCEDIIDDIPCRFRYVETTPNDFGLTIEEILLAKNKELNQWASLKKALQMRPEHVEKKEQRLYKLKAKNEALKRKIFKSIYGEGSDDDNDAERANKAKISKSVEGDKNENSAGSPEGDKNEPDKSDSQNLAAKKKKKKKRKAKQAQHGVNNSASASVLPNKKAKLEDDVAGKEKAENANTANAASTANKTKKKKNKNATLIANKNCNDQKQPSNPTSGTETKEAVQMKSAKSVDSEAQATACDADKDNKNDNKNKDSKKQPKPNHEKSNLNNKAVQDVSRKNPFKLKGSKPITKSIAGQSQRFPKNSNSSKSQFGKQQKNRSRTKNVQKPTSPGAKKEGKISDERLKAYGINPKRFHRKERYGQKSNNINKQSPR